MYISVYAFVIFKPGTCSLQPCMSGFLKLLWFAHWYVCVSVCVSALRTLITSGMIWCDIGYVRLVKQVSQLFPAFNYFTYMTLAVDKMDERGHINTAHCKCLPKN